MASGSAGISPTADQVLLFCVERPDTRGQGSYDTRTQISAIALGATVGSPHWPSGLSLTPLAVNDRLSLGPEGRSHHIATAFDRVKNEVWLMFSANNDTMMYRIGKYVSSVSLTRAGRTPDFTMPGCEERWKDGPHDAPSIIYQDKLMNFSSWVVATGKLPIGNDKSLVDATLYRAAFQRYIETPSGREWKGAGLQNNVIEKNEDNIRTPRLYYPTEFPGIKYVYSIQLKTSGELYVESMHTDLFSNALQDQVQWDCRQIGGSFVLASSPTTKHASDLPEPLILQNKRDKTYKLYIFLTCAGGEFAYFYIPLREDGSIPGQGAIGGIGWNASLLKDVQYDHSQSWRNSISTMQWNNRVFMFAGYGTHCRFLSCPVPEDGTLPPSLNEWQFGGDVDITQNKDANNLAAYCAVKVPANFAPMDWVK